MRYSVTFFCPDTHLTYNLHSLDKKGIGGGATSRIRIAHALANLGYPVTIYNNCPKKQVIRGVQYIPFENAEEISTDVFIESTSGGSLDLALENRIDLKAKLKLLMVHGIDPPKGVDLSGFDFIYSLSNFVTERITNLWNVPANRIFTSYRGVKEEYCRPIKNNATMKDPFGLVYLSHPSKGLSEALDLLDLLIKKEPNFSLHVYGGYGLWGDKEYPVENKPNVTYHGLIGQKNLARELTKYSMAIFIQNREEPFGISLIESMKAGCIPLANSVGAFPELIEHGWNGFLIDQDGSFSSIQIAAEIILDLINNKDYMNFVSNNAINTPLDWKDIALAWSGHWDYFFSDQQDKVLSNIGFCPYCEGKILSLADGMHCIKCGRYIKQLLQ